MLKISNEIAEVKDKIQKGSRLSFEDGVILYKSQDVLSILDLARAVKERLYGKKIFYVLNQHIDYTNICSVFCKFCGFYRTERSKDKYTMSIEEIIKKLEDSSERFGVDELHMVGGVNPKLPFEFYTELLRAIKSRFPQVIIKAFTAVEIEHISKIGRKSLKETLVELKYNGLDMLPGGSAEIFSEGVRKRLCPEKISGERWLEIHETAHNLGMPSNATMLFGHIETIEDRVDHIIRLRNAQDRTRGFFSFIPLMFYPQLGYKNLPRPTGLDYLKTLAISRLLLDNIPHVKVYWRMAGLGLSQIGLLSGGDDLDGTIIEERIYESMGAKSPDYLGEDNIRKFIESSGAEPVRRNGLYENTN